jgi:protease-4
LTYSWFTGSNEFYKKKRNWKLGTLYHVRPNISLGFVIDRINEPDFNSVKQRRLYRPGMALRFLDDKVTLSADGRWKEGEDFDLLEGNFRVRTEGMFLIGMTFNFDQSKAGFQGRTRSGDQFAGGSYFVDMGAVTYGSVVNGNKTGFLKLGSDIKEEPRGNILFSSPRPSILSVITSLRKGAENNDIDNLLIKIDGLKVSLGAAQEIRESILEYRRKGKNVTVFLNQGDNLAYYLASAANNIIMNPSGYLELRGLAATATFYKGAMDKLGIKAQVIATGPHKTYADPFTETGLSDEAREQIDWLLDDIYNQFVDDIGRGRNIHSEKIKNKIDNGPYTAKDAYDSGLVDKLMHYDELIDGLKKHGKGDLLNLQSYYSKDFYNDRWSEPKKIAIVYAAGSIAPGVSGYSFYHGTTLGSSTLSKAIKTARTDSDIKAVVLRVDSPGGDMFASFDIYRELELLIGKKPLVISMAGVAASGGYYISCPGDEILANPATITGSIGVVMGKPDLSGLHDKIGINKETIVRGKHADIRSMSRPATDEEIDLVKDQIWQYYDDFKSKVSSWRKIDIDSVEAFAGGRVWTGRQAKEFGLIDTYGGIWDAIELARQKAGIDSKDKIELKILPRYGVRLFSLPKAPSITAELADIFNGDEFSKISLRMLYDLKIE